MFFIGSKQKFPLSKTKKIHPSVIVTYKGDDSYILFYFLHPMLLSRPNIQFPWQSMWFLLFFLAWSELILTELKWTGLWSSVFISWSLFSKNRWGEFESQIQVWIRKWIILLCKKLQWKKLIYLHSSTAGLVTLPREGLSVTSSVSLMSTFFPAREK